MIDPMTCACRIDIANARETGRPTMCRWCGATIEAPRARPPSTAHTQRLPEPVAVERNHDPAAGATRLHHAEEVERARKWSVADLAILALWANHFYGAGQVLREPVQTSGADGHGREDDRTAAWHEAAMIHRRFERMRRAYRETLWFVFVERNTDVHAPGSSVMRELGERLSTAEQRASWTTSKKGAVKSDGAEKWGRWRYDSAKRAWELGSE